MAAPFARFRGPSAPTGQAPSCAHCSAPLAVGQTWCLECGTAAPGRLGPGPGLRSSLGVVGVTLLLVTGAVAAAYAALASQSKQATVQTTAQAVAQAPAAPGVAAGTVAPATGSAVPAPSTAAPATAVPAVPKIPAATPTPAAAPAVTTAPPKTTTTTTTTTPAKAKAKTPTTTTTGSPAPAPAAKSAKILLDTNAASDYDPYSLPLSSFGDPGQAIDGDPQTAWSYRLDPATPGKTLIGLAINLNSAQTVRSVTITTPSPGMSVELYGASTPDAPVSISDPNWRHLATKGSLPAQATIKLKTGGRALRYLLVWITHPPAGATSVGISELSVST